MGEYKNISTFYPKIKEDYEEDYDYNSSILKSPFTLTKNRDIVSYIIDNLGNNLIAVINLKGYFMPLILSLLMNKSFHYLFIYCDSSDPYRQILINAIIRIGKTNKCEIREGPVTTSEIEAKGMVYIGIDDTPIKPAKVKGVKISERCTILILTSVGDSTLKLQNKTGATKESIEIEDINITLLIDDGEPYYDEKHLSRFDKKITNPLSDDKDIERKEVKSKKKEKEEIKKKEISTKSRRKSIKESTQSSEEEVEIKPKKKISSSEELVKAKKGTAKKSTKKKIFSSEELVKPKKGTNKKSYSTKSTKDDEKYDLNTRPDHANLLNPDDPRIPKKGGWMEDYNGITTFYIMGASKLKEPPKGLSDGEYKTELMKYLNDLLSLFIEDKKAIKTMTKVEKLQELWVKAWTHETYDINNNYEALETIGDSAVGYSFISLMEEKDPLVDEGELTALKSRACDKNAFRQVSWELKMDKWLRMGGDAKSNTNTAEDVVESFCGVLQVAGSFYLNESKEVDYVPSSGIKYVYDFVKFLYGNVVFAPEMYISDPKTALLQAAEGLGGGIGIGKAIVEEFSINELSEGYHVHNLTISWSDKAMKSLEELGKKQKRKIISVEAGSKKTVIAKAYFEAIKELGRRKTSVKWLRDIKKENKWDSYDKELIDKVMKKLHKNHGDDATLELYVPKSLSSIYNTTVILLAVIPDGTRKGRKVKLGVLSGKDPEKVRVGVLENYIKKK